MSVLLSVTGLSKAFGPVQANDDVSFSVRGGEVHALLGENGAGKSTLVKTLYGVHPPDRGSIEIDGACVRIDSPAAARELGIGLVFQDMRLIPALTVWENVALYLADTGMVLRRSAVRERIDAASRHWGLPVHPDARVGDLSVGEWQRVELLKVLLGGARLLILDEPTSVLTPAEADSLFAVVTGLRAEGVGTVLITHKLREVRQVADRVTVLRGGRAVLSDADPAAVDDASLIEAMVGRGVPRLPDHQATAATGSPVLELRSATMRRSDGDRGLDAVDLRAFAGQVLGVAGVAGNGQEELVDALTGVRPLGAGQVLLDGTARTGGRPGGFQRDGVLSVVPDPVRQFVVPDLTVGEHAALWEVALGESGGFDVRGASRRFAERAERVGLPVATARRRVDQLSGGNVQRVLLTLALSSDARALVVSYPTRGLDVSTAQETRAALLAARERGVAVVVVSEDLDELIELSDRLVVLAAGRVAGTLAGADLDRSVIGTLMTHTEVAR